MYEPISVLIGLRGIVPLKMDRFHGLPEPKNDDGYRKQAEYKVYRTEDGWVAIPTDAIAACMRMASSEVGARKDSKRNRQTIRAGVFFDEEFLPIQNADGKKRKAPDGYAQDLITRGTGDKVTRVQTYRPVIGKGWYVEGIMNLYGLQPEFARQCLDLGGVRWALLSHRPKFGRFFVEKFEVVKT